MSIFDNEDIVQGYDGSCHAPSSAKASSVKKRGHKKENEFAQHKLLEENDYEINVKFSNTIPVGTFCYEICIYDSDNNISQPSTV